MRYSKQSHATKIWMPKPLSSTLPHKPYPLLGIYGTIIITMYSINVCRGWVPLPHRSLHFMYNDDHPSGMFVFWMDAIQMDGVAGVCVSYLLWMCVLFCLSHSLSWCVPFTISIPEVSDKDDELIIYASYVMFVCVCVNVCDKTMSKLRGVLCCVFWCHSPDMIYGRDKAKCDAER